MLIRCYFRKVKDATPAIFIVICLFIIPSTFGFLNYFKCGKARNLPTEPSSGLITWKFINQKVPWSLIFLLGGGFALAEGGRVSGMSYILGQSLSSLKTLPPLLLLFVVCLSAQILTEFTSNVAIANILLPVLAEMVSTGEGDHLNALFIFSSHSRPLQLKCIRCT